MRDAGSLEAATKGASVVVHLAAVKRDEPDSDDVNVLGARRLVAACLASGCQRVINISTQSAKIARKGTYGRTKAQADEVFHASPLDVTTLLLSLVYGEGSGSVFTTMLKSIRALPVVPVFGDGKWISAPLHVGDVSSAIAACIEHDKTVGKLYDLGGPNLVTFDQLIDRLAATLGLHRYKVHIPLPIALGLAHLMTAVLRRPPITVSNILGSNQNTAIDIEPARRDFGFDPIDLSRGLSLVLGWRPSAGENDLTAEALAMAQYLMGAPLSRELIDRYADASHTLLGMHSPKPELVFVRRHPWALPFMDAAVGLMRPESLLRKKLLLMTAILEATPNHAEYFLKQPASPFEALRVCASQAARTIVKAVIGLLLYILVRRRI